MPFYIGGGLGPVRYYHRIGGHHRPRQRRARPRRHLTEAQLDRQAVRGRIAGIVILSVCAVVGVAVIVALA